MTTTDLRTRRATTPRLDRLVQEVREAVRQNLPGDRTAHLVARRLAPHLGAGDLLTDAQREGSADHYRQHVLHVEEDGGFSVVALVWLPGQRTSVHDHVSWCVTGVHEGREHERRYRLTGEGAAARLVATEEVVNEQGDVCGFAPPGDIHRVWNGGAGKAVSLHVYGADIDRLGSSVRRVYEPPADER
ncbi:cysteine dioxygenase family protein [Streptomyces sp. NRRL S-340]|uniref:cysteine dioxygenase family protein n=1 Tax=Streptomyces sp. NRRL S-340 TaxID=1463901 RepID=UPI00056A72AD|nr:cysteine dioxygenase family protein [Streptomyces sp. NRRL S-340]